MFFRCKFKILAIEFPIGKGESVSTLYLSHEACLDHLTPHGHPERPDRYRAVAKALSGEKFTGLIREQAPLGTREDVLRCHPAEFYDVLANASPKEGMVQIDGDTVMSPGSFAATLHAVGGAVRGVDAVFGGEVRNAFCGTRPPGHHAERSHAMGFCIFNAAAIAARHAREVHGAERVAVVDWDVHHGNGTQDIFWADAAVMYCSTHQMPLYPGTGALSERGEYGTVVNAPLRAGDKGEIFREAFTTALMPRLESFAPDIIIISAGFDAHWRDPLGSLQLEAEDFAWATRKLMDLADRRANGRIVSILEGGYDLQGLGDSVDAHVDALMAG
jgi:acetoin utilization deacetylase AcuC-like enzyme